jgi:hypothetical protein
MAPDVTFDYATPYEIMVGVWTGMSTTYKPDGEYWGSVPSRVVVYWDIPGKLLKYKQDELPGLDAILDDKRHKKHPNRQAFSSIVRHNFDLAISGKACQSRPNKEKVSCVGAETRPGIYLFHLHFPKWGHYYNNQYFVNPNERNIIGPFIPGTQHDQQFIVAQTFTRVSYDVPEEYRDES